MKGDFTRFTFDRAKRYSSVRMQQGRVQLDADWNEQVDIDRYLRETALADVIGRCGVPKDENGGGFRVTVTEDGSLTISHGRIYVDGILCENLPPRVHQADLTAPNGPNDLPFDADADADGNGLPDNLVADLGDAADGLLITAQEDLPLPGDATLADLIELVTPDGGAAGSYLVYLDLWQRHLTALEEPAIREVALGGPDTATRTRTLCQVKVVPATDAAGNAAGCDDEVAAYDEATAPPSGCLRARARPADDLESPCVVPAAAGYTRLENQLYRVEVHAGGELGGGGPTPTFKWSRDNGHVVTEWRSTDGNEVEVASFGRDDVLGFQPDEWVELTDDGRELRGESGQLRRISGFGDETLILDAAPGDPDPLHLSKVRRWNMTGLGGAEEIAAAPDDEGWIHLEGGVQIDFAPGTYRVGDYWVIPARAFLGENAGAVEWPDDSGGQPAFRSPHGIEHHYCRLAVVEFDGENFLGEATDCRPTFCPLTDPQPAGEGCCCCTVSVGDGVISEGDVNDLAAGWQQALAEAAPGEAIELCLLPGRHVLTETLTLDRGRVRIRGCSGASQVEAPSAAPAFVVSGDRVTFEGFSLIGGSPEPLIEATGDLFVVREMELSNRAGALLVALSGIGLRFIDNRCRVGTTFGVEISGVDMRVERNRFDNFSGSLATDSRGMLHLAAGTTEAAIFDNDFRNAPGHAITLGGQIPQLPNPVAGVPTNTLVGLARLSSPFVREVLIARNRIVGAAGSGITTSFLLRDPLGVGGIDADGDGQVDLGPLDGADFATALPARIEGLTVVGNLIRDCVERGPELGARPDGAPYGGVVLGHVERLSVNGNTIVGNGASQAAASTATPAVAVAGIFVQDGRAVEVTGNRVVDNGLDNQDVARAAGPEGGIVMLEITVDLEVASSDPATGLVSQRPAGPSAARVCNNQVESVRGLALQLGGSGPMQADGNQISRIRRTGDPATGAVLIVNSGLAPILGGLARLVGAAGLVIDTQIDDLLASEPFVRGGPVSFCGNQVRFDQRAEFDPLSVAVMSFDDVAFCDNRLDSRLPGSGLRAFVFGVTVRCEGNGMAETLGSALLSLWSYGFVQSTGTGNQGSHCILIEIGSFGIKADAHNLAFCCSDPELRILELQDRQPFPCQPPQPPPGGGLVVNNAFIALDQ